MAKTREPVNPQPDLPATYEAALQELETLVGQLDGGQLPLDSLLSHYERANALLRFCRARLDAVEQQIQVVDQGVAQPWTGAA
jgi:exodeoxyribonuclease VII small subunit